MYIIRMYVWGIRGIVIRTLFGQTMIIVYGGSVVHGTLADCRGFLPGNRYSVVQRISQLGSPPTKLWRLYVSFGPYTGSPWTTGFMPCSQKCMYSEMKRHAWQVYSSTNTLKNVWGYSCPWYTNCISWCCSQ